MDCSRSWLCAHSVTSRLALWIRWAILRVFAGHTAFGFTWMPPWVVLTCC